MLWVIWSHEHKRWWAPKKRGYVKNIKEAGRYCQQDAIDICQDANRWIPSMKPPEETMLPAPVESE